MSGYWAPILYAVSVWWFTTGLILFLDGLPQRTFKWSMATATALLVPALYGIAATSTDNSVGAAYLAFSCAVMIWGWQEMAFLMGYLTGPRKHGCIAGCTGWRHFLHAIEAILYHELGIIAFATIIVTVTWGGSNQAGTWTFLLLWGMRQSAKLNLFFGVRNLGEEFLPPHLQYLRGFFTKKPMNFLFPFSVSISTAIAALMIETAVSAQASPFDIAAFTLLAALMGLAILEHWFMVLPLPVAALWSWGLRSRTLRMTEEIDPQVDNGPALFIGGR
jgi:putative photosynthetic complex assembly protein 2